MKKTSSYRLSRSLFLLGAFTLALFAAPQVQPVKAGDQVPWRFYTETRITETIDVPGGWEEVQEGSGIFSHLGKVTIRLAAAGQFVLDPEVGLALDIAGEAVVTAANGDTLTFEFSIFGPAVPPSFPFEMSILVTGGTGRFAGVSGAGTGNGYFDEDSGHFVVKAAGTMTSVGAGRK